jgi:ABC-type uncharacterized transport system permease subunit
VTLFEAVLLTVITASTPLLLAALGELVAERAGVLNLGVEGMMIMGAACGFAGAYLTGSTFIGAACGVAAGVAMAAIFALLTLGLAANQVASGLFVGQKIEAAPQAHIPWLSDLPLIGRALFAQDGFVYASWLLLGLTAWFLYRSRGGLILRAVGDNPHSAHALGYGVRTIRLWAVLFGGGCAGLAGAYLPLAYTPFWVSGMTAGRGWIALALVVFSSWLPGRLAIGAYLFGAVSILQLHAQGAGLALTPQVMTALPYLATIVVLVVVSALRRQAGSAAPASLGLAFVPER